MRFNKVGFIGFGLIGGSIAKKMHLIYPHAKLYALSGREETITLAHEMGLIENETMCRISDFYDCDCIFLCTPVQQNIAYLKQLKDNIKPGCLITDVGSVKSDIHKEVIALNMETNFIGGHPMAGSEKTGLSNASEYLLENAYYIITPTAKSRTEDIEDMRTFVAALGAIPMVLDYRTHDRAAAAISHLPHILAYTLVNLVKDLDDPQETMKTIAAGGFRDLTRIASSSPVMWQNICLSNQEQVLELLDSYLDTLKKMRLDIAEQKETALLSAFQSAKDYRDSFQIKKNGIINQVYEIYLDLIDEAGQIATVATILASNNLSIKNIGIIHNREFEEGVLRLEMYDRNSLEKSVALLKKYHYTVYER